MWITRRTGGLSSECSEHSITANMKLINGVLKRMVVNDILKVLYAPHRAFNDIVKNPRYLGPMLILVIFVAAQVGSAYVVASKSLVEQTMPAGDQADLWTENAALWQANPGVT